MAKIVSLYISLVNRNYRYVLLRQESYFSKPKIYELYFEVKKKDLIRSVLIALANEVDEFYDLLCDVDEKAQKSNSYRINRYFAKSRDEIGRPATSLGNYWLIDNPGGVKDGTEDLLREACKAANIKFGYINDIKFI